MGGERLFAFSPDGLRAAFLYARMVERLADSVAEIVRGCSAHVDFEEKIVRLSERVRASSRLAPEIYCIYFDLLQAVRSDNLEESLAVAARNGHSLGRATALVL